MPGSGTRVGLSMPGLRTRVGLRGYQQIGASCASHVATRERPFPSIPEVLPQGTPGRYREGTGKAWPTERKCRILDQLGFRGKEVSDFVPVFEWRWSIFDQAGLGSV